jgi:hypothetical protein
MADVYTSLSPADQLTVRSKLFAVVSSKPCPNVDTSSITSADTLNDAGNLALAVDCFQATQAGLTSSPAGVLDQATYSALVGWWPALPTVQKVAVVGGGVAAVGLVWYGVKRAKKSRRRLAR